LLLLPYPYMFIINYFNPSDIDREKGPLVVEGFKGK